MKWTGRTEILHDVLVLQVFEELDLGLESAEHALFPLLVGPCALGELDLLNCHQESTIGVHSEIDLAKRALPNESTLDPLIRG